MSGTRPNRRFGTVFSSNACRGVRSRGCDATAVDVAWRTRAKPVIVPYPPQAERRVLPSKRTCRYGEPKGAETGLRCEVSAGASAEKVPSRTVYRWTG